MADSTNPRQVGTQGIAGRAIATLAITIPITLSGKDANGVEFTEKTRTIVIDRFGGKIATKCVLSLGSEMTLHNPIVGQTASIRVVRVGEKRAAEEPYEISVQFVGSQNIWGIEFPSYDGKESALPAPPPKIHTPRMPAGAASSPGQPTAPKFAVPDASSSLKPAETGRAGPSLTPPTMQTPQPSPLPVAVETLALPVEESNEIIEATLTRLTQQIGASGENKARLFQEEPEESSSPIGLLTQTNQQDTAKNIEERESSVEEHVKTLEGDLQASRTEMQQLVAELEELKHAVREEMGKTLREVQENRPKIVELAMGDLGMKVRGEIDSVTDELIDLTQRRVQEGVAAALEPLIQGALNRVNSATEEQSARAGQGIQSQLSRLIEEGQAQLGRMLQSTTSEFGNESDHISGPTFASAQAEIAAALSKSAVGFDAQLHKTADEVTEAAAKQLQKQAEDTLLLLSEELKTSCKKVTAETEGRLSSAGRSALDAVSSASDYALGEFQVRLGERAETSGDNCIKRLEESLAKAEGEQQKSALSSFRKALEQECAEPLARMKSDLAQALKAVSEQAARQASALNDLRKAVEEESLQTLANVKGAATQTIGEISGQIERQANALKDVREAVQEESARILAKAKSDANQAMRGVSAQAGRDNMEALNDLRKSLAEETAQALPKFQEDLAQTMGEVAGQVQQQMNMLSSLLNLIEKESAQILSKVKDDVAEALAENSRLAEQHTKSTQAALSDWETRMGSRVELQLQQLEGKTRASLETLQGQSEELLKSTLEKLRSESRALPEQIEASPKKAAGNIEQNRLARIPGVLQDLRARILKYISMKLCPCCGYSNFGNTTHCRKCHGPLVSQPATTVLQKSYWIGPEKARVIRNKALAAVILGLMVKVYWGGYGPWPVIDYLPWAQIRPWLEPLLLYGGGVGYLAGWVLSRVQALGKSSKQ
ncbi:MAG: hypothetical protein ABSH01_22045 [Terriglobia bacterium]|jgi:DNA anti-recombination protein RmuC